jgi:hypothetical protein
MCKLMPGIPYVVQPSKPGGSERADSGRRRLFTNAKITEDTIYKSQSYPWKQASLVATFQGLEMFGRLGWPGITMTWVPSGTVKFYKNRASGLPRRSIEACYQAFG